MIPWAFDTETALIRPAMHAPPMVCLTWAMRVEAPKILHWTEAKGPLRDILSDKGLILIGHNVAYDMAVICAEFPELTPLVFKAYRENRVTCTKKRQQLLDIAGGVYRGEPDDKGVWRAHNYDLDALSRRHLGQPLKKDGWRLRYAEFRDVPIEKWVEKAKEVQDKARALLAEGVTDADEVRDLQAIVADVPEGCIGYPLQDASTTLGVYLAQEKHKGYLQDQYRQAFADFVLHLSSAWGLRTYAPGVEALKEELTEARDEVEATLQEILLVRADGTRDMKAVKCAMIAACKEFGLPIRRTAGHAKANAKCGGRDCEEHVSLDADACDAVVEAAGQFGSETPFLDYAEFSALTKMLSNDVKMLEAGTEYPVHTHYDLAETGRTTSSKPNIQNLNTGRVKRKNSVAQRLRPGIRQAFIPRPGRVFMQADYPQLELYTLAQCCYTWLGFSKLGDTLKAGLDPHLAVAARICGIDYDEALKNRKRPDVDYARQVGKVFNFGKPGGLGNARLILYARKTYGVILTESQCIQYTAEWHEAFPEMRAYFARIGRLFPEDVKCASVVSLTTERHRGRVTYCAACNNGFQGLGADCMKSALCLIGEAMYSQLSSPLYGSRTVACVHDEIIAETDDTWQAHDAAHELARLMVEGANRYLPDVPIPLNKLEPALMRRWSKDAKQVWTDGRLVPWTPQTT
jgi:DNA polymerase-1